MKKAALILFLFYAKTLMAQPFSVGVTGGGLNYSFRQQPNFTAVSFYSLGLCAQYTLKDTGSWSIEVNADFYPSGMNNNTGIFDYYKGGATAEYLCFNPFKFLKTIQVQLKAGFFAAAYGASTGLPSANYGPAFGAFLGIFKFGKKTYFGLDATYMVGLQNYSITGNVDGPTLIQTGNTNISNANVSIKFIRKI